MIWSEKHGAEIYVFHNGKLIYKRWIDAAGNKRQPSMLFNRQWPSVSIISARLGKLVKPSDRESDASRFESGGGHHGPLAQLVRASDS